MCLRLVRLVMCGGRCCNVEGPVLQGATALLRGVWVRAPCALTHRLDRNVGSVCVANDHPGAL